ncbi:hypothetical protein Tco_1467103 [Tanacetum coccineum]
MYHDLASPLVITPAYTNALGVATPRLKVSLIETTASNVTVSVHEGGLMTEGVSSTAKGTRLKALDFSMSIYTIQLTCMDYGKDISQSLDKAIPHCTVQKHTSADDKRTLLQSRDCISTKLYEILIRAIMTQHIFSYKNEDFINGQIDNYALANRAFIPGRNLDLEHYWSASQVMDHGPRGSVHMTISRCMELTIDDNQVKPEYQQQYNATLSRGHENWAREFANERVHHGPVDDQWVDEFHKLPSL